jgi:hypothetical protein
MGKLIKNHWARLISLTAGVYQVAAALQGFFWPKIFWDFATKALDILVKPIPFLPIVNLVLGILIVAWEWPLPWIAGTSIHRSIEARLVVFPLSVLASLLMYQSTNAGLYLLIATFIYFAAYAAGEVSASETVST